MLFVCDLVLNDTKGGGVHPKNDVEDGEAERLILMEIEEVASAMRRGEFKPNCALVSWFLIWFGSWSGCDGLLIEGVSLDFQVIINFLIRHDYVTAENEGDFIEVATRLRGAISLSGPVAN